jgi:regulator of cell morphogenesis and NO signaling
MPIDPGARIGDIVLEQPATLRVFDSFNVDYCCGAHRSLEEACKAAGQDLTTVLEALARREPAEAAVDPAALAGGSLTELMDHIEATHHAYTREALGRLTPLLDKVVQVHGARHPELARVRDCFQALAADLLPHLEKEERILFPYLRALEAGGAVGPMCFGSVQGPIQVMLSEHEAAGDLLRGIRESSGNFAAPEDACTSFRALYQGLEALEKDLHLHIYLENHILFPRGAAMEG